MNVFGISYGNSTASVALYKEDGRIDIIANDAGDRATSTNVYISNSEKVVGLATGGNVSRVNSTITRNKSLLEPQSEEGLESIKSSIVVKFQQNGDQLTYRLQDGDTIITISPQEVSVIIFKKLLRIGQSAVGEVKLSCVIAVPHYWDTPTRNSIKLSAEKAGWNVLQLVSEPTAALLAYQQPDTQSALALVYRLGGYTCQATVIRIISGYYEILGSERREVGVRHLVDMLSKHLAQEFKRKTKLEPEESRRCMCKLWCAGESMVRTLSTLPTCSLYLESLCEGVDFTASLSRARLDSLISGLLPQLLEPLHALLNKLQLTPQQIDKVVSVGGGMNMPRLRSEISSIFSNNTEICDYIQPQEVTAIGAATQAGLLTSAFQQTPPQDLNLNKYQLKLLKSPLTVKVSSGDVIELTGPVPQTKTLTLQSDENISSLDIEASQQHLKAQGRFEGFDSPAVKLNLHLTQSELLVSLMDMGSDSCQSVSLVLSPA